jgi:flagellar biosynthesis/type III secretory pathway protein FliH
MMAKKDTTARFKSIYINPCNNGYGCYMAIILFCAVLICSCGSNYKEQPKQQQREIVTQPSYQYQAPYYPSEPYHVSETPMMNNDVPDKVEKKKTELQQHQPIKQTTISRYYEEGYENGYDDGEDDAVSDNGWGGQYDDGCKYKGKKRKDYQLGYEEGYEAGYYDNKDGDE